MEEMIICVVDRVEEGIAVCFADEDGRKIIFPTAGLCPIREGDALAVTVTQRDGIQNVTHVRPATDEEHIDHKKQNALRLRHLFDKNKH